jgi:hypothetical protein
MPTHPVHAGAKRGGAVDPPANSTTNPVDSASLAGGTAGRIAGGDCRRPNGEIESWKRA